MSSAISQDPSSSVCYAGGQNHMLVQRLVERIQNHPPSIICTHEEASDSLKWLYPDNISITAQGYESLLTALLIHDHTKRHLLHHQDFFLTLARLAILQGHEQSCINALSRTYSLNPNGNDVRQFIELAAGLYQGWNRTKKEDTEARAFTSILVAFPKCSMHCPEKLTEYSTSDSIILAICTHRPEWRKGLFAYNWNDREKVSLILGHPLEDITYREELKRKAQTGLIFGIAAAQGILGDQPHRSMISYHHSDLFHAWQWVYEAEKDPEEFVKRTQAIGNSLEHLRKGHNFLHPKLDPIFSPPTLNDSAWEPLKKYCGPDSACHPDVFRERPDLVKPAWDLLLTPTESDEQRRAWMAEAIVGGDFGQLRYSSRNPAQFLVYQGKILGLAAAQKLLGDTCPFKRAKSIHDAWKWAYEDEAKQEERVALVEKALTTLLESGSFVSPKRAAELKALLADQGNVGDLPEDECKK